MSFGNPTEYELAWADFIKHCNAEARETLNFKRRAKAHRALVSSRKHRLYGPAVLHKITERSRLVYGQTPLGR